MREPVRVKAFADPVDWSRCQLAQLFPRPEQSDRARVKRPSALEQIRRRRVGR